ncbi:hypothetical protein BH09PSE3_BH09PSE3_17390 [soil metagenome]
MFVQVGTLLRGRVVEQSAGGINVRFVGTFAWMLRDMPTTGFGVSGHSSGCCRMAQIGRSFSPLALDIMAAYPSLTFGIGQRAIGQTPSFHFALGRYRRPAGLSALATVNWISLQHGNGQRWLAEIRAFCAVSACFDPTIL